jgi:thymidine phosphorylase
MMSAEHGTVMRAKRMGINTYQESVIYMRADCPVCRAQGFETQSRIAIRCGERVAIATLYTVDAELLAPDEAGLSDATWRLLAPSPEARVQLSHPDPNESFSHVRAKVYGHALAGAQFDAIVRDIVAGRYSTLEMTAFVTACAGKGLTLDETIALTRSMVDVGARLQWPSAQVVDKHCVGGLPGNRTTPIVVAIVAAGGLTIPKTSSRAITSPAGTADAMETLAPVDLDLRSMRRVVDAEGGCVVWGGALNLAPVDDMLIRVERPLDFDSEGQLVASVISKKVAAGSTHVVIDVPVGPTAKVRSSQAASALSARLSRVGEALGLRVRIELTDGTQPVGRGVGPALEARDVMAVLRNAPEAPADLRERALVLAGALLETGRRARIGEGIVLARACLARGDALRKFEAICRAQGGMREPPRAMHRWSFDAIADGRVTGIDNRLLARIAKLAGAPTSPAAGVELAVRVGERVSRGQPLYSLHASSPGELDYARTFAKVHPQTIVAERT